MARFRVRPNLRAPWVALAAIAGMLLASEGAWAAGAPGGATPGDRAAQMRRNGCCCIIRPAKGCCCETIAAPVASSLAVAGGRGSGSGPFVIAAGRLRVDNASTTGTCDCRASDPASPGGGGDPEPRTPRPSEHSDSGRVLDAGILIGDSFARPRLTSGPPIDAAGGPSRTLHHLRTTHLLI